MPTTRPLGVAVISGGRGKDDPAGLASAASVARSLAAGRFVVTRLIIAPDGIWHEGAEPLSYTPARSLSAAIGVLARCDVAFLSVHGRPGGNGAVAALCTLSGVPFVGSDLHATALAADRVVTKLVASSVGITTPSGAIVTSATVQSVRWNGPVAVKPVTRGRGRRTALVRDAAGLQHALDTALMADDRILVEEIVVGREVHVGVLGRPDGERLVGELMEVTSSPALMAESETTDGSAGIRVPAQVNDVERKGLVEAALTMFGAIGCSGVACFAFFLTAEAVVLNEITTTPGLTELSEIPRMFAAAGMPYPALLAELVRAAEQAGR
ncbi:D-alanine--D-alanine ligase [Aeromicrobium sp. S22]|uniref:D-alanine--D-alanine ligase family protein n=1 Tax=Aeromicrobium sp. S22 TaxID=2662029 RepID=UPI00129E6EBE|nr:D-alanine--D-alanine ligase [Aeromicrobium sp. S22]MRK01473.1 D-alanine--D-alanine ligase [Aeromicrobium sp. S22]